MVQSMNNFFSGNLLGLCLFWFPLLVFSFTPPPTQTRLGGVHQGQVAPNRNEPVIPLQVVKKSSDDALEEAQRLLEKSRKLREEIAKQETEKSAVVTTSSAEAARTSESISSATGSKVSKWSVPPSSLGGEEAESTTTAEYRLYIDIGREPGTWMEPRWGASGARIEFTLDVRFQTNQLASGEAKQKMVQDNKGGSSSAVYTLESAPLARLRSGFDEMKCENGAFRFDNSQQAGKSDTLRFYVNVQGTPTNGGGGYGDVNVPEGGLYFSLPAFGSIKQLSSKGEMPVTVQQMGWHTGWRRSESRIVGIFKAVPIADARKRDGF